MRRVYQLTGVAFLVLAGYLGYFSIGLTYYTRLGPGPGFFPRWLCGILTVLALAILARATWAKVDAMPDDFFPDRRSAFRIASVIVALLFVALAMTTLGFQITMFLFYLALVAALGRWRWIEAPILATLGSFATYYVFVRWLSLPLPVGIFGL